jgi:hypothetical protein
VKDTRPGESLWQEWHGQGYEPKTDSGLIYFTHDHIDVENEVVSRALASTLQRDGISHSLADGFNLLTSGSVDIGWGGILEDETEYWACDESGETQYGDFVEKCLPITWIEL